LCGARHRLRAAGPTQPSVPLGQSSRRTCRIRSAHSGPGRRGGTYRGRASGDHRRPVAERRRPHRGTRIGARHQRRRRIRDSASCRWACDRRGRDSDHGADSDRSGGARMNEADAILAWLDGGRDFAIAVVTKTWSSAPRPAGAMMAVAADGQVIGSLSGGCVESAVHELALEVLSTGQAASAHYGTSDAEAFAVGLACGGQIDVLVTPVLEPAAVSRLRIYLEAVAGSRAAALALELPGATEEEIGRAHV